MTKEESRNTLWVQLDIEGLDSVPSDYGDGVSQYSVSAIRYRVMLGSNLGHGVVKSQYSVSAIRYREAVDYVKQILKDKSQYSVSAIRYRVHHLPRPYRYRNPCRNTLWVQLDIESWTIRELTNKWQKSQYSVSAIRYRENQVSAEGSFDAIRRNTLWVQLDIEYEKDLFSDFLDGNVAILCECN